MGKSRRSDLALVGAVRPVRNEKDAERALRSLDSDVDLAGRNVKAFGVVLELVDQRFHGPLHLATSRPRDLAILHDHQALAVARLQFLDALLHDAR
jgi:hypothetical protein